DHGINMARGFNAVMEKLESSPPDSLQQGLKSVAMTLISTVGGASGPLYGTAFLRCSKIAQDKSTVDSELASLMLNEAVNG
ncbi:MAG TPA: dihydroxyacetone kinase, partial [Ruminococcaceae bacterium]|nr:dihydroxyacetone kinase [Oscillospiraceae bacterium]